MQQLLFEKKPISHPPIDAEKMLHCATPSCAVSTVLRMLVSEADIPVLRPPPLDSIVRSELGRGKGEQSSFSSLTATKLMSHPP
jgi:hypothetical protein